MAILLGVRPGGRDGFAVSALFWTGRLPGRLIASHSFSGVRSVLHNILGIVGEWGALDAVAIDAPLTWSGSENGERPADAALRDLTPPWVPRTWFRPPNALPGAVAIQGPALAWVLALEAKRGNLPPHTVVETHSRGSLSRIARDLPASVVGYRDRALDEAARQTHRLSLVNRFVDAGIVSLEIPPPQTPEELESLVCAVTAMAVAFPECGLTVHELEGGDIRPVGTRSVALLSALP